MTAAVPSIGSPALWAGFLGFVLLMLALDLGVLTRRSSAFGFRAAMGWSVAWMALALVFNAGIYAWSGAERALEFFAGYLVEKALSVDNLFVFVVVFAYFGVPAGLQRRVLFWGILGALVMRAVFIVAGGALLQAFHWSIYLFGAVLVMTGARLAFQQGDDLHPERNVAVRVLARLLPVTEGPRGGRFLVREGGRTLVTPLFLALATVEISDVVFAVDSIPAVFAVTTDPFIVFTSNIFAILGLRSLYFLLAGMLGRFRYLNVGLAGVLVFVGAKMLLADVVKVPIGWSLAVIAALLAVAVAASLLLPASPPTEAPNPATD